MTIGIIGFGMLGRQIVGLLSELHATQDFLFFDDLVNAQGSENIFPFDSYLDARFANLEFYVGLGYLRLQRKAEILLELREAGRRAPSFVHPSCHMHPTCRIGEGCIVFPMCNLDQEVELGNGVLLNNSVVISHNCTVGDAAYLSPGVVLAGHVTIGAETFLGAGTLVSQRRHIGRGARLGIGSVVTRDIPNEASAIGNPLRILERKLELG